VAVHKHTDDGKEPHLDNHESHHDNEVQYLSWELRAPLVKCSISLQRTVVVLSSIFPTMLASFVLYIAAVST